jgi:hypothetical protein
MLFPCVVGADFIETERFYAEAGETTRERGNFAGLDSLQQRLDVHLSRKLAEGTLPLDPEVKISPESSSSLTCIV